MLDRTPRSFLGRGRPLPPDVLKVNDPGDVTYLIAVVRRWRRLIGGFVLAGLAISLAYLMLATPQYRATARILIDFRRLADIGQDQFAINNRVNDSAVESQATIMTSEGVLRAVSRAERLDADPEFSEDGLALDRLLALAGLADPADASPSGRERRTIEALGRRLTAQRVGVSYVIELRFLSADAAKAARIANAVVESYLAEGAANRAEAANRATAGLSARIVELRADVNRAESRVQAYKAENGLIGTRDVLVTDQQLTQLNAQLAGARVRAADAQARVDGVQRMRQAGLDAGATDAALASPAITALRAQYAELSRKQAELANDLGPRHPQVTSIASQIRLSRQLIDQELARYGQAARTDLARALATVAALEKSFDAAKGNTVGLAQASIRLRELEREVEASRAVYEAFLLRARETGQQARLDAGNARVITQAVRPVSRSYPPPAGTLALLGLVAGLLSGIALTLGGAWLKSEMHATAEDEPDPREVTPAARPHPLASRAIANGGTKRLPAAVGGHP